MLTVLLKCTKCIYPHFVSPYVRAAAKPRRRTDVHTRTKTAKSRSAVALDRMTRQKTQRRRMSRRHPLGAARFVPQPVTPVGDAFQGSYVDVTHHGVSDLVDGWVAAPKRINKLDVVNVRTAKGRSAFEIGRLEPSPFGPKLQWRGSKRTRRGLTGDKGFSGNSPGVWHARKVMNRARTAN